MTRPPTNVGHPNYHQHPGIKRVSSRMVGDKASGNYHKMGGGFDRPIPESQSAKAMTYGKTAGNYYKMGGGGYEFPKPVGNRNLEVADPNQSEMSHHFEDAE
jgi:hypothetical protein